MTTIRIILALILLSETLGWWYAASAFWQHRSSATKQRTTLGVLVAGFFTVLGFVQGYALVVSLGYASVLSACIPTALSANSLVTGAMRALCAWGVGRVVGGGDGPVRNWLRKRAEQFK